MAAWYAVLCPRKELCRKCGSTEHVIREYTKEPECAMGCKHEGVNARHVKAH